MSIISNGESGASVRTKLNTSLVITDAISDTASGIIISDAERTKLGTIEGAADVTDAINVASSGALMDGDFNQSTGSLFKDSPGVYHAIKSNLTATLDPTVNDDLSADFEPFSFWINTSTTPRKIFICTDSSDGAAVWKAVGVTELSDDLTPQLGGNLDLNSKTVGSATSADLTKLNAITSTAVELNYIDGVTSLVQDQINSKQTTITLTTTGSTGASTFNASSGALNIPEYSGEVTAVTGTAPVISSGGTTPVISMAAATASVNGYLTSTDYTTFNSKEAAVTAGTTAQYYRGDKSFQNLNKAAVGLDNVDNTTDVNKPVSTANQTALDLKADLTGATFTGSISSTNLSGTNTGDQNISGIATNTSAISGKLSNTGGAMTGAITGNIAITGFRPYLTVTAGRTLTLTDAGKFIIADNGAGTGFIIRTSATVEFTLGTEIDFIQKTAGTLAITGDTGVTLNGAVAGSVSVTAQWGGVTIKKINTNEWIAVGKI